MANYELFPNEKEIEYNQNCEEELRQLETTIANMQSRSEEQIKMNNTASTGEKFLATSYTTISVIVSIVVGASVCSAKCNGDWSSGFPAMVEGIICMIIVGIAFYGIGILIENNGYKKTAEKNNQLKDRVEQDIVEQKKKKTSIENEYRDKVIAYKKAFYEETDQLTSKFVGNAVTEEIVGWLAEELIKDIDSAERTAETVSVQKTIEFSVDEANVLARHGKYIFEDHRISNLNSAAECMALAKAIGTGMQMEIMAKFPVDPSGMPVRVNVAYTDDQHLAKGRVTYISENND